jgi:DMSO/TMAO reductase YedYZ molybdopterin-dependent catalytic subunit
MKRKLLITRREALATGMASLGALLLPGCSTPLPPTYGHILRMGDALTYAAHRTLLPGQSMVKEYNHRNISSFPAIGTINPADSTKFSNSAVYDRLRHGSFADWRLRIEGLVAHPGVYSIADLQSFPSRTQITKHTCEEGWSAIAEWSGVQLSRVLTAAGMLPKARFINFYTFDGWIDSIDLLDALHPQTILAYGMNGKALPIPHGAPLRLRVENQLGYKSLKYVERIAVVNEFDDGGKAGNIQNGWSWYAGI